MKNNLRFVFSIAALFLLSTIAFAANVQVKLDTSNGTSGLAVLNSIGSNVATIDSSGNINIISGSRYKINGSTLDATAVSYVNPTYPTVGSALDYLLYVSPGITSFTNTINQVEIGTTVTSTTLNWTLNKTMTSLSLNNGIGSITPSLLTYTHSSSYTTDRTYTLTASDGTNTAIANTSIYFRYSRYWGYNASASLNDGQINALSHELATDRLQTRNGLAPSSQYIYIAYPAAWGAATFTVNGLPSTDWTLSVQSHTNSSGNTSSYNVYRTNNLLTGTYNVVVN